MKIAYNTDGEVFYRHRDASVSIDYENVAALDIDMAEWPEPSPVDDDQATEEYKSHYYDPETGEISIKYERTDDETGETSIREEVAMTV